MPTVFEVESLRIRPFLSVLAKKFFVRFLKRARVHLSLLNPLSPMPDLDGGYPNRMGVVHCRSKMLFSDRFIDVGRKERVRVFF